jgi:multicomponent Na+:H+ antiporter subunit D
MLLLYICGMFAVAFYILSGAELGSASLFTSTFAEGGGMAPLFFSEHAYGKIAAFGFLFVGAFALLYGLDAAKTSEQAVSLVAIGSAVGVALAGNFLTLFIFWEFVTISTGGLVLLKKTPEAVRMGYHFILFQLGGGLLLFLGIMQHYAATGSFLINIPEAGLVFFLLGIGIKAAFLPLHVWLLWGYPSSSFVSTVVLAGLTTKVGVYAVARILPAHSGIVLMGACMALFGAICALLQSDFRRLLSYSLISMVGLMVAGVALGEHVSIDGGFLYMVNHMLYKALLFMSAGAVIYATGKEDLHDLYPRKGGGKKNLPPVWLTVPVALIGAVAGGLSGAGTPLFNGYAGKYLMKQALHGVFPAEWMIWLAGVVITIAFCKFIYFGFIQGRSRALRDIPSTMKIAILAVSVCCLLFGLWPELLAGLVPYGSRLSVYSLAGVWASLQILLAGVAIFALTTGLLARRIQVPDWLSVDYLFYQPLLKMLGAVYTRLGGIVETVVDNTFVRTIPTLSSISQGVASFDERTINLVAGEVAGSSTRVGKGIYDTWLGGMTLLLRRGRFILSRLFFLMIKMDYDPKGERIFQLFNVKNFDFDFLLFMITLFILLGFSIFLF